jgi:murein DD-endopeptidase MepM/ murein hydrolase activator NlpD
MRLPFNKPIPKVTYGFGPRLHPIEKIQKWHNGIDFASAIGTPVFAISNGTVIFAGPSSIKLPSGEPGGGGYIIKIRHKVAGKWITSASMHLKKGSLLVKRGDKVAEGQKIAESGNTGASTGPHLHFEIQRGKSYVWSLTGKNYEEPISFIKTHRAMEKIK